MIYIAVAVIVVVGVVAYLLLTSSSGSSLIGSPVSASTILQLQNIANNNTLANQVGSGIAISASSNLPGPINAPTFTINGKPEILYVGGDFCPYCAITRWGLVLALMRFGSFTNLTYMESSPTDVYADTPTFSFVNSSYNSNLVHFNGFEITNREEQPINNSNYTPLMQSIYGKYAQGIPFIDFANTSIQDGAVVSPQIINGQNWNQIISQLNNPGSNDAQAIIANANIFTAYICRSNSTLNSTASACKQNYVKSILAQEQV
ncbi:MAG: DUF929 family protein [Candidatus Micrarchaeaceae archaeon]